MTMTSKMVECSPFFYLIHEEKGNVSPSKTEDPPKDYSEGSSGLFKAER